MAKKSNRAVIQVWVTPDIYDDERQALEIVNAIREGDDRPHHQSRGALRLFLIGAILQAAKSGIEFNYSINDIVSRLEGMEQRLTSNQEYIFNQLVERLSNLDLSGYTDSSGRTAQEALDSAIPRGMYGNMTDGATVANFDDDDEDLW